MQARDEFLVCISALLLGSLVSGWSGLVRDPMDCGRPFRCAISCPLSCPWSISIVFGTCRRGWTATCSR